MSGGAAASDGAPALTRIAFSYANAAPLHRIARSLSSG